jgi:hypothetical protein
MLRNKQIHSVMNHVRALEGLGGPSLCQECGARTAAQRTVWCALAGLAACADTQGRQQRIRVIDEHRTLDVRADTIVGRAHSFTELSPGGRGLHVFILGAIPKAIVGDQIEIYSTARSLR